MEDPIILNRVSAESKAYKPPSRSIGGSNKELFSESLMYLKKYKNIIIRLDNKKLLASKNVLFSNLFF